MSSFHWYVLACYLFFLVVATGLAFIQTRLRPTSAASSVWRKYPVYILLNIAFFTAAWLPHNWHALTLLLALIGGLGSWELVTALQLDGPLRPVLPLVTVGLVVAADWLQPLIFLRVWLAILLLSVALSAYALPGLGRRALCLAGCLVYLPLCLAAYVWMWHDDIAGFKAIFLYATIATSDALAQITGQLWGRRPLVPSISPTKTVEGALGGIVFAAIVGVGLSPTVNWQFAYGAFVAIVISVAGLVGDIAVSGWKRAIGLKDFGTLLGANGGFLDRFDALIFAAPVFFLLVTG